MSDPKISRRHFLGGAAVLGGTALMGCSGTPHASDAAIASSTSGSLTGSTGRAKGSGTLVLINLDGANDGLNTVCPVEDSRYRSARGDLALDGGSCHPLSEGFVLHPALVGCKALWDQDRLAVVHGVGFAELDRSHFHCRDVWQSAQPTSTSTGWVGRWLDQSSGDVLGAVAVDRLLPLVMRGETRRGAVVPPGEFNLPGGDALRPALAQMSAADRDRADAADLVAASNGDLLALADAVGPVLSGGDGRNVAVGDPDPLASRLETVAALIAADLGTRVYTVTLGGFDTHAAQAATHHQLLSELDGAITAFLRQVAGRDVTVAVWSEFGRRVAANASGGTDHGKASVMLLAGRVQSGHHGDPPPLDKLDDGDLRTTVDFRSVLGGLAEGVLGLDAADLVGADHRPLAVV